MNITIAKSALLPCLDRANGIADKKSPVPALANVLLRAHAGKLSVIATDLYMAMSVDIDATIEEPGVIALPAKDLYERIRAMPDGPIQIRRMVADNGAISALVKAVGAARKYTVSGLDATDYPVLPTPEPGATWQTFPAGALRHLLDCVQPAVSLDETRFGPYPVIDSIRHPGAASTWLADARMCATCHEITNPAQPQRGAGRGSGRPRSATSGR